ncbi:MAG: HAD family phosphatase [Sphaerochaetaceae bacterium]|nr:HAD family phosphatase [Sphaerochaetaceae bacterium]
MLRLLTRTKYKRNKNKEDSWAKGSKKLSLNLKKYITKNNATVFRIQSFCKNSMYAEIAVKLLKNRTDVCPILGNDNSIETTAANVTKANALEKLCKDLNLDTKALIAFGDSANDYDMLKMAGFSVAMGNADSKLKDISNYIADPVTQDGAAKAINYLFLQKNPQ